MYSHPPVYTRVNRSCPIKKLKLYQAKQAIKSWLMNLTYTNTEPILPTNDYDMLNHNFPHSTHSPTHIHTQKLTHTYNFNLSITHNHVSRCCLSLIIVTISFCLLLLFFFSLSFLLAEPEQINHHHHLPALFPGYLESAQ